jgi:glucosyl-dolichyl phosphate glucuronosyltransferase
MNITAIVCTYNRCQSLANTLDSVARSILPESVTWEVLVVDNNSSDQTREVVVDFCRRHPNRFRYIFEPQQGKSYALNTGVREARGEVLAFTDDDVIVDPHWLHNLTMALHESQWAGVGGRVFRKWTCPPPRWLSLDREYEKVGWALVSFDLGDEAGKLTLPPVGANMAFQKEVFTRHGVFRTDLGPQGSEISSPSEDKVESDRITRVYEDVEFGQRLFLAGERLGYEPSAVVYHPVPENRLTKKYFLAWWFGRGRGEILITPTRPALWGIPRRYVRMVMMTTKLLGRTLGWLLALKPYRRFYYKVLVWEMAGAIMEGHRQWFGAGSHHQIRREQFKLI